jgi:hypothetical protein
MIWQRVLAFAGALLGMTACETAPDPQLAARQDIEFVRGCWVAKQAPGGSVAGFLRLLPDGADGPAYQGHVQDVSGGTTTSKAYLSFARDGSSASTEIAGVKRTFAGGAPPQSPGRKSAVFSAAEANGLHMLVVYSESEKLAIYSTAAGVDGRRILFEGERDGCD